MTVPIWFQLETIEAGRLTVRTAGVEVAAGAWLRRVKLLAGGVVVLSLPINPVLGEPYRCNACAHVAELHPDAGPCEAEYCTCPRMEVDEL